MEKIREKVKSGEVTAAEAIKFILSQDFQRDTILRWLNKRKKVRSRVDKSE